MGRRREKINDVTMFRDPSVSKRITLNPEFKTKYNVNKEEKLFFSTVWHHPTKHNASGPTFKFREGGLKGLLKR